MNKGQTSESVASKAGKILKDGRYGKNVKSVAGSALSQAKTRKKKARTRSNWEVAGTICSN